MSRYAVSRSRRFMALARYPKSGEHIELIALPPAPSSWRTKLGRIMLKPTRWSIRLRRFCVSTHKAAAEIHPAWMLLPAPAGSFLPGIPQWESARRDRRAVAE